MMRIPAIACLTMLACSPSYDTPVDSTGTTSAQPDSATTPAARADALVVTERGIGNIVAGMTIAEASQAAGADITAPAGSGDGCTYLNWPGAPSGVQLMSEGGRVVRVDVQDSTVATAEGARAGDAEERVIALYPGRVAVTPHKYTSGAHYLTVTPSNAADSAFRIVFETENSIVTRFRSGRRPAVEYVERCG